VWLKTRNVECGTVSNGIRVVAFRFGSGVNLVQSRCLVRIFRLLSLS